MYTIYIIGRYNTVLSCTHQSIQSLYRNRVDSNKYSTSCSIINTKEMCCTAHACSTYGREEPQLVVQLGVMQLGVMAVPFGSPLHSN